MDPPRPRWTPGSYAWGLVTDSIQLFCPYCESEDVWYSMKVSSWPDEWGKGACNTCGKRFAVSLKYETDTDA